MKPERHKQGGKGRRDQEKGGGGDKGQDWDEKKSSEAPAFAQEPLCLWMVLFLSCYRATKLFPTPPPFLWQREQDHKRQMQSCRFNGLMAMNKNGAVTDLLIDFMCNWHTLGSSVNTAHKAGCVAVLSHRHRIKLLTVERPEG